MKRSAVRRCSWTDSVAAAALLSVFLLATPAVAEEPPVVELSESQLDLNARAIEFIQQKRLEQAIPLFESSLALGESNVTYLNLGRTLARLGRCEEAAAIYDKVETAPQVSDPPRDALLQRLQTFRSELSTCGTKVVLECHPPTLKIRVNEGEPFDCPTHPLGFDTGTYTVTAIGEDGTERKHTIEARPDETIRLVLSVETKQAPVEPVEVVEVRPITTPAAERSGAWTRKVVGIAIGITGLATLTTAIIVDATITTPKIDDYNAARDRAILEGASREEQQGLYEEAQRLQRLGKVLFPVGTVLTVAGFGLWVWPAPNKGEAATLAVHWRFAF